MKSQGSTSNTGAHTQKRFGQALTKKRCVAFSFFGRMIGVKGFSPQINRFAKSAIKSCSMAKNTMPVVPDAKPHSSVFSSLKQSAGDNEEEDFEGYFPDQPDLSHQLFQNELARRGMIEPAESLEPPEVYKNAQKAIRGMISKLSDMSLDKLSFELFLASRQQILQDFDLIKRETTALLEAALKLAPHQLNVFPKDSGLFFDLVSCLSECSTPNGDPDLVGAFFEHIESFLEHHITEKTLTLESCGLIYNGYQALQENHSRGLLSEHVKVLLEKALASVANNDLYELVGMKDGEFSNTYLFIQKLEHIIRLVDLSLGGAPDDAQDFLAFRDQPMLRLSHQVITETLNIVASYRNQDELLESIDPGDLSSIDESILKLHEYESLLLFLNNQFEQGVNAIGVVFKSREDILIQFDQPFEFEPIPEYQQDLLDRNLRHMFKVVDLAIAISEGFDDEKRLYLLLEAVASNPSMPEALVSKVVGALNQSDNQGIQKALLVFQMRAYSRLADVANIESTEDRVHYLEKSLAFADRLTEYQMSSHRQWSIVLLFRLIEALKQDVPNIMDDKVNPLREKLLHYHQTLASHLIAFSNEIDVFTDQQKQQISELKSSASLDEALRKMDILKPSLDVMLQYINSNLDRSF